MKKVLCTLAAGVIAAAVADASAAVLTVTPVVTNVFQAGTSTAVTGVDYTKNQASAYTYEISLYVKLDGLSGSEVGIGNFPLNVNLVGLSRVTAPTSKKNYVADSSQVPLFISDPGAGSQPRWNQNADQGTAGDLQNIVVGVNAGFDPTDDGRLLSGKDAAPGTYFGKINVVWDGTGSPADHYIQLTGGNWSTSDDNGNAATVLTGHVVGGNYPYLFGTSNIGSNASATVGFGAVPEPASLSLLGLGGLAALARRRRA